MNCQNCGAANAATAKFCENCGATLGGAAPPQAPPPAHAPAPQSYVPNHLVKAILSTLFCCLPAGIVAIVYAAQVNSRAQAGDHAGALKASQNAALWGNISIGIGLVGIIIWILLAAAGAGNF